MIAVAMIAAAAISDLPPVALLISAGNVSGKKIPGTDTDVRLMSDILIGKCGFKRSDIMVVGASLGSGFQDTKPDATVDAIMKGLDWLNQRRSSSSRAVLYFSGHGTRFINKAGEYHEAICAVDGTIQDTRIRNWRYGMRDQKLYMVFDCCYAGGAARNVPAGDRDRFGIRKFLPTPDEGNLSPNATGDESALEPNGKHLLMAACRKDEQATQVPIAAPARFKLPQMYVGHLTLALYQQVMLRRQSASNLDVFQDAKNQMWKSAKIQTPTITGGLQNEPLFGSKISSGVAVENGVLRAGVLAGFRPGMPLIGSAKSLQVVSTGWLESRVSDLSTSGDFTTRSLAAPDWTELNIHTRKSDDPIQLPTDDQQSDLDIVISRDGKKEIVTFETGAGKSTFPMPPGESEVTLRNAVLSQQALRQWQNPWHPRGLKITTAQYGAEPDLTYDQGFEIRISARDNGYLVVIALEPNGKMTWYFPGAGENEATNLWKLNAIAEKPAGDSTMLAIMSKKQINPPSWLPKPEDGDLSVSIPAALVPKLHTWINDTFTDRDGFADREDVDVASMTIRVRAPR